MNILMLTNVYTPHVGGVARSVALSADACRRAGHRVVVIAPQQPGAPDQEPDVIRIPAICKFNGTDFSVRLPVPGMLAEALQGFTPDIVHSHHPFLIGDTALRLATRYRVPVIYTFHTFYERYTHYVPGDSPAMQRFVVELTTGYANLCDHVLAPSRSVAETLLARGVRTPVTELPTGIQFENFAHGDGAGFRRRLGIPPQAFVIGTVSRLAPEKNIALLTESVLQVLQQRPDACFLAIGSGPALPDLRERFQRAGTAERLYAPGSLEGPRLTSAYHAMDVFAFASTSETQGIVLAEAMACGLPVAGLDAPGVREVIRDGKNGRLIPGPDSAAFAAALLWSAQLPPDGRAHVQASARETARTFSLSRTTQRLLDVYAGLVRTGVREEAAPGDSAWEDALRRIKTEWDLLTSKTRATRKTIEEL